MSYQEIWNALRTRIEAQKTVFTKFSYIITEEGEAVDTALEMVLEAMHQLEADVTTEAKECDPKKS